MSHVLNPTGLGPPRGYSHGMIAPAGSRILAIAGQIAWNSAGHLICEGDFAGQFAQALRNVLAVVQAAGGQPSDLLSLRIYVTDKRRYLDQLKEVGHHYREILGNHYPAMALVQVADLLAEGAMVEIEALAAIGEQTP